MLISLVKSKIHRARVTDSDLNYQGSITIDTRLMDAAGILPFEMVQVLNLSNGARIQTYAIEGCRDSGAVCLNGAAARWFCKGDLVIILSSAMMTPEEARNHKPVFVFVDDANKPVEMR